MPVPKELIAHFEEKNFYHTFCKSVGNVDLFKDSVDKYHFLQWYFLFLGPFVDTYFFNLLDNHVHFAIKIKSEEKIVETLSQYHPELLIPTHQKFLKRKCSLHTLIAKQFQRLFIKYTIYYNKNYLRKGHLFVRPFKRKHVVDSRHFARLMVYIHANEVHHKISKTFENSKWSSYNEILGYKPTKIMRTQILALCGGRQKFILLNKQMALRYSDLDFEDF